MTCPGSHSVAKTGVWIYACICLCICTLLCMRVEAEVDIHLLPSVLRYSLFRDPGNSDWASLGGHFALGTPSYYLMNTGLTGLLPHPPDTHSGSGDPDSWSHDYATSILSNELSVAMQLLRAKDQSWLWFGGVIGWECSFVNIIAKSKTIRINIFIKLPVRNKVGRENYVYILGENLFCFS